MELREVKAFYLTPAGDSVEGVFKLRRTKTGESSYLLGLCQRRNPKTQQVADVDQTKFTKLWLAASIFDCPIQVGGMTWKDNPDIPAKAKAIDENLEDDMYVFLIEEMRKMRRLTPEKENLSEMPLD